LLISQSGSCIPLLLQLCLLNSSPHKVEQFSFEYHLSPTRLAQQSTTALFWEVGLSPHLHLKSLCLSPPLLNDSPGLWEVGLSYNLVLSPCSLSYLTSLTAHLLVLPAFSEAGSVFHSTPTVSVWLQFPFYAFQFCLGGLICPGVALPYVFRVRLGESCAVHVAHLLGLQIMQAALKADDGENWHGSFLKADTYWDWVPSSVV
jgi:hypothetical protein